MVFSTYVATIILASNKSFNQINPNLGLNDQE